MNDKSMGNSAMTAIPARPKIYHIVHVDRLPSILRSEGLLCDADVTADQMPGTMIGMNRIKERRLTELTLQSHPDLYVGKCVPFYLCPRSVMLYMISKQNHIELSYQDGQEPIIHLMADLYDTVEWATAHQWRWAFTLSNAGSRYFEDRASLAHLNELPWDAINAHYWNQSRDEKQSEFLLEKYFPWSLVEQIGVYDQARYNKVMSVVGSHVHKPDIKMEKEWYY